MKQSRLGPWGHQVVQLRGPPLGCLHGVLDLREQTAEAPALLDEPTELLKLRVAVLPPPGEYHQRDRLEQQRALALDILGATHPHQADAEWSLTGVEGTDEVPRLQGHGVDGDARWQVGCALALAGESEEVAHELFSAQAFQPCPTLVELRLDMATRRKRPVLMILETIGRSQAPVHISSSGRQAAKAVRALVRQDAKAANDELMEAERQFLLAVQTASQALVT